MQTMRNDFYIPEQYKMSEPPDGGSLGVAILAIGAIVGILLTSCQPEVVEKIVTQTELRTDTVREIHHTCDTVRQKDSSAVTIKSVGDTVLIIREYWHETNTIRETSDDRQEVKEKNAATEQQQTQLPKPKERKLGFWETVGLAGKMLLWAVMLIAVIFTAIKVVPMIRRWIKKDGSRGGTSAYEEKGTFINDKN